MCVEVHQSLGLRYRTLGVCQVKCRELMKSSGGKVDGRVQLQGVEPSMMQCEDVGLVEYWMRLKVPVTHSAKPYQVFTERRVLAHASISSCILAWAEPCDGWASSSPSVHSLDRIRLSNSKWSLCTPNIYLANQTLQYTIVQTPSLPQDYSL